MKNIFIIILSLLALNLAFASEQNSNHEYTLIQDNELKITTEFSGYIMTLKHMNLRILMKKERI